MKCYFFWFIENHRHSSAMMMLDGDAAENPEEAFINWYATGHKKVEVMGCFLVPEESSEDDLLALERLTGKPFISELLAIVFQNGFDRGEKNVWDIQRAFSAGRASK